MKGTVSRNLHESLTRKTRFVHEKLAMATAVLG
jgi:hypothetical protein